MYKPKKVKLKNSTKWEVRFYVNGRGSRKIRRRFDKKVDADNFIKDFFSNEKDIDQKTTKKEAKDIFFIDEYNYWLNVRGDMISPSHKKRVVGIISTILKMFPDLKVSDIDNIFLSELRRSLLKKNLSKATVNRYTNAVTTVLNFSYNSNRINKNPWANFGLLSEFREEMKFWEKSEIDLFLKFSKEKYSNTSKEWVYIVYLVALSTGMRAGEIWGLKVSDINFSRGLINVERQFLHRERVFAETKGKNVRKVPCGEKLSKHLLEYIEKSHLSLDSFLFQNARGNPINHYNFRNRYFLVDIKESKVSLIRFHDLRHTALTMLVQNGVNLKVVQSIAGHADIKTTMKYVHLLSDSIESVAKSFQII